jgi:hypothetical protein
MRRPTHRRKRLPRGRSQPPDVIVSTQIFPDAESRARWLLDFLRLELDSISISTWRRLRREAWGFVDDGNSAIERDTDVGFSTDEALVLVDPGALRDLQEEVRRGIKAVRDGRWWLVKGEKEHGIARWGGSLRRGHRAGVFRVLFVAIAVDIVEEYWSAMYQCPQCDQLFLRQGKQMYCSKVCSRRTRWARFALGRPERDYRAERERAFQRRHGARVKLGRKTKR